MNTRQIIKEVKQGTAEYKVDEISVTDLQNAKYYLEDEKLSVVGEFGIYEGLLHEQITQGIQWYYDTECIGYLDLARNILLVLIEQYINEGYLK